MVNIWPHLLQEKKNKKIYEKEKVEKENKQEKSGSKEKQRNIRIKKEKHSMNTKCKTVYFPRI